MYSNSSYNIMKRCKEERWCRLRPPAERSPLFCCFVLTDKVALKILDKTRMDTQVQRLLSREISSMELLRHPNVLHLYEVVETPSRLHLVLEYAGGGDLHNKICNEGKLSDNASKITFAQILSAIKYMVSFTIGPLSKHLQTSLHPG